MRNIFYFALNYFNITTVDKIEAFKLRTKGLSLRVIKLFRSLSKMDEARIIGKQLLRSATSVAANYRALCRARSGAEFYSTISIVVEEADKTLFWPELLLEAQIISKEKLSLLMVEYEEVLKIVTAVRYDRKLK